MSTIAILPVGKDTIDVPNAQLDDLQFEASVGGVIHTDTVDGADSKYVILSGGGAGTVARGSIVVSYGNENANPGFLLLYSGEVTGSTVVIGKSGGAIANVISFQYNGAEVGRMANQQWAFGSSGTIRGAWVNINGATDDNTLQIDTDVNRPTINFSRSAIIRARVWTDGGAFATGSADSLAMRAGASGGVFLAQTATAWAAISDERRKHNISPLKFDPELLLSVQPITFKYLDDTSEVPLRIGFSAQNLLPLLPGVVRVGDDEDKTLSVQHDLILPYLIETIKHLYKEITELKQLINQQR